MEYGERGDSTSSSPGSSHSGGSGGEPQNSHIRPAVAADHKFSRPSQLGPCYLARRRQGGARDLCIAAGRCTVSAQGCQPQLQIQT